MYWPMGYCASITRSDLRGSRVRIPILRSADEMQTMINEEHFQEARHAFYLSVSGEPDPSMLVRVLTHFLILNVLPRKVVAELSTEEMQRIRIEANGMTAKQVSVIAAKIDQLPTVERVYWCQL